jgi:hypothetical protein
LFSRHSTKNAAIPDLAKRSVTQNLHNVRLFRQPLEACSLWSFLSNDNLFRMVFVEVKEVWRVRSCYNLNRVPFFSKIFRIAQAIQSILDLTKEPWVKTSLWFL